MRPGRRRRPPRKWNSERNESQRVGRVNRWKKTLFEGFDRVLSDGDGVLQKRSGRAREGIESGRNLRLGSSVREFRAEWDERKKGPDPAIRVGLMGRCS